MLPAKWNGAVYVAILGGLWLWLKFTQIYIVGVNFKKKKDKIKKYSTGFSDKMLLSETSNKNCCLCTNGHRQEHAVLEFSQ